MPSNSVVARATKIVADATGFPRAAAALVDELKTAGLLAPEPMSGMLANGDTFGDEDEGPEGGCSIFEDDLRAALTAMVDRWEPDTSGADRRMWENALRALGRLVPNSRVQP